MQFNSISFIVFMFILIPILAITKNKKARHCELLLASYFFYGCWDYRFCALMFILTVIAFVCGKQCKNYNGKVFLIIGVVVPLVILGIFKYFNFFTETFMQIFNVKSTVLIKILLPVGISFYTFQSISYVIDIYRSKDQVKHSFLDTALYISFFPQLVAGPIVKANDFFPQLEEDRNVSLRNIEAGIQLFVLGLMKKIVIADRISIFVEEVYDNPHLFHGSTVLLAIVAYSIQIYCDFSGYSDMAIGCAKCIGYDLKKNFDIPYISGSVQEFWKRWHISLSNWLKEYLYISMGGNRKGQIRTYINLFLTMVIGGLWHGASWNFVLWGALHGLALCIHRIYTKLTQNKFKKNALYKVVSIILTFIFVSFTWIVFRVNSLADVWHIIKAAFNTEGIHHNYVYAWIGIIFIALEVLFKIRKSKSNSNSEQEVFLKLDTIGGLFTLVLAIGMILAVAYISSNPFIYFQF